MKAQRMNRSKSPKEIDANPATTTPTTEAAAAPEMPVELNCFEGMTPAQAILAMLPKAKGIPEAEAAIAGWFSGIPGMDFGIAIPEWARKASAEFLKATGLPLHKPLNDWTPEEWGKMVGCLEIRPQEHARDEPSQFQRAAGSLSKFVKSAANDDAPEVARDFHTGRGKAAKVADKVSNLSKRTQIFLFIACGWQTVATFKGQVELWQWLTKEHEPGKAPMVSEWDYSDPMREMREVCQRIGLKFKKRPGKPPRSG